MAYHKNIIIKGELGEFSKIEEEFSELKDAYQQNNSILQICELSDLIGAIELYADNWNLSLDDIIQMKNSNKESFEDGTR